MLCRALAAAAPVHRAHGFQAAARGARLPAAPLEAVAQLTYALIQAGALHSAHADSWLGEASAILLDAWVDLLADLSYGVGAG